MTSLLLGLWFLLYGLGRFVPIPELSTVLAVLALGIGLLMLIPRLGG